MAKKRKIDIWDLLPPDANRAIDELGYALLEKHGYDVTAADTDKAKHREVKEAMKAKGEELRHSTFFDPETGKILFWFELVRGGELVERTKALQFVPIVKGEADGEGTDQAGPAPSA